MLSTLGCLPQFRIKNIIFYKFHLKIVNNDIHFFCILDRTSTIETSLNHFFRLSFPIHPEFKKYKGNATRPHADSSDVEKDRAVLVYKFITKNWARLSLILHFNYIDPGKKLAVSILY